MIPDPIVDDVRKLRDEYARQFNYDIDAMFRDLKEKQEQSGRIVVSFPPRRVKPVPMPPTVAEPTPGAEDTPGAVQG